MTKEECVSFLDDCKEIHIFWAEPGEEAGYVATGEWDSAEEHREYAHKYQKTIEYIKEN